MNGYSALRQYRTMAMHSSIAEASPHRMITMLMDGALERISMAKGHVMRHETAEKGQRIGSAISIIDGLRASLDMENGGEMAANLASLYEYMARQLLDANLNDCEKRLDEVSSLLREIKEAWVAIPVELHQGPSLGAANPLQSAATA
jgi:flagellar protein FliS